jgi:polar amino acid transport system substrate-binding protein
MKQISQRLRNGRIDVVDVPIPEITPEGVLVSVRASLLSSGTERSKVEAGRASLIGKARARPEQVRQVVEKARRDGLSETLEAVRTKLDQPSPLGYSSAGVVLEVGSRVQDVQPGQRVACGGGDYAVHAEVAHVPGNLVVPLPDDVPFAHGAFATVGAIALHGVRQADVRVGERAAVIGLGLVGQLTGQLLRAAGCTVVGIDLSEELVQSARELGSIDVGYARNDLGGGDLPAGVAGCDSVLITAATKATDPVELAARLCRDRATVVVVGDVKMDLPRSGYYGKELDVKLSRSYGPGRYDRAYEERGIDYPIGYVRWTERRNMQAVVELAAAGKLNLEGLISRRLPVDQAQQAYDELVSAESSPLGIVFEYPDAPTALPASAAPSAARAEAPSNALALGVIGAGSFAQRILIPGFRAGGFDLRSVASGSGLSATAARDRFEFGRSASARELIADPDVGTVAIATRHSTHAALAAQALRAGKAVFVEKPPFMNAGEETELRRALEESGRPLAVGFNRRHAPFARELRAHVTGSGLPVELLIRVSAGPLPEDHWLNDLDDGGGRLIGEGCHFVDLACWIVGSLPQGVSCSTGSSEGRSLAAAQSFAITLRWADGSLASILYGSGGAGSVAKEYVEAHAGGRSAVIDDFRTLVLHGSGRPDRRKGAQDKGHRAQLQAFRQVLEGGAEASEPSPLDTMSVTLAALRAAQTGTALGAPGGTPAALP